MPDIQMAGPWITEHEEKIVLDALRNGWYGKQAYCYVEKLEAEFASYHDRKRALMTPNCTTALHLLLAGLGVGEGDEVIAPDCTWIGSVAAISARRPYLRILIRYTGV
jgi:perosamine synthetase